MLGRSLTKNGGPESSRVFGCSTCIVNSKLVPTQPSTLLIMRTPITPVISTPASITTQRSIDKVFSVKISDPEQRFAYVLPPIVPPPDSIAFIPYRDTNEPTSRIPPCIGPKVIKTS